jgi:hypothetical protein
LECGDQSPLWPVAAWRRIDAWSQAIAARDKSRPAKALTGQRTPQKEAARREFTTGQGYTLRVSDDIRYGFKSCGVGVAGGGLIAF